MSEPQIDFESGEQIEKSVKKIQRIIEIISNYGIAFIKDSDVNFFHAPRRFLDFETLMGSRLTKP